MIGVYRGTCFDPYRNLAVEQLLLESIQPGQCILYLWQNENTVVIGRNQNPWKECRVSLMEEEGGKLARRLSGGGAVFHDRGNLNFTFLMPQADYDLDRQLAVIQRAVEGLGIPTERSGRNDILAQGHKFSGNAFYKNGKQAYHHGTLLVDADMEKLGRYLTPSKAKLQAKGVDSVRSRVCNMREICPDITVERLADALEAAFMEVYGQETQKLDEKMLDGTALDALTAKNASWEWNFGQKMPFSVSYEGRFPWGGIELALQIENGIVRSAKVYTDAMDWELAPKLEQILPGCRFEREALKIRIHVISEELCALINEI